MFKKAVVILAVLALTTGTAAMAAGTPAAPAAHKPANKDLPKASPEAKQEQKAKQNFDLQLDTGVDAALADKITTELITFLASQESEIHLSKSPAEELEYYVYIEKGDKDGLYDVYIWVEDNEDDDDPDLEVLATVAGSKIEFKLYEEAAGDMEKAAGKEDAESAPATIAEEE